MCVPARREDCGVPAAWADAPIRYVVERSASDPADLAILVGRAFSRWGEADCGHGTHPALRFAAAATAVDPTKPSDPTKPADPTRGVVRFSDERDDRGGRDDRGVRDPGTLALTRLRFAPDSGEILRARTTFYAAQLRPHADPAFLESIALHEAGHFLGLAHSADPQAVMFGEVHGGSARRDRLGQDDIAAICAIYPPRVDPGAAPGGGVLGVTVLSVLGALGVLGGVAGLGALARRRRARRSRPAAQPSLR